MARISRGACLVQTALVLTLTCNAAALMPPVLGRRLAEGTPPAGGTAAKCPRLSRELLASRAKDNTIMIAVMNEAQFDFSLNWLHHVKKAGITYYVIAATEEATSERLMALGEPCFDRIDPEIHTLGLKWGQEGWRRMTWAKVFVLDAVVDWGFHVVVSDVDVVWLRDPLPLLSQHAEADLLFSEDGTASRNEPGDAGLEKDANPHHNFNTGVYLMRNSERTRVWAHAWRKFYGQCTGHDQECLYRLMRNPPETQPHPDNPRVRSAMNATVWMAIMPASMFANAHTYILQRLHEVKRVQPYAVHMTWTYNGIPGKRTRLRDAGLWAVDSPAYYKEGSFVTVDLDLPEASPSELNRWNENEDLISFHLHSIHAQLQQAYVGMALALAAGRAFILPQFQCYCEKIWYAVVRCRVVDAQAMPLPVPCPQDYLFDPAHYTDAPDAHGPPLDLREAPFLQHEAVPREIRESVLTIQPSATLDCTDCVKEEPGSGQDGDSGPTVLVPPGLPDAQLLPLLLPKYGMYRVWRLSFKGVGAPKRAFGGFANVTAAAEFDKRMDHVNTFFCCRREEESRRYHKQKEIQVPLRMHSDFKFSELKPAAQA